ncbi:hypothetical protein [Phenylobacterium montanum]|uniref:Uncharacterized protein n=1 Tax=Phenylobacterium montanum TaxID=2823693 RepID=A0A975G4S9_9CAUL|nr:hypothetical protein [Caulobacter sp. S6]QUD90564.1 hypothetical protein KCG34_12185 [Caulobacter sp. S6]
MLRIWELTTDPNHYLFVQTVDLRYFSDRFDGTPIADQWEVPAHEVLNRSKKVADFTSWQIGSKAFLVSDLARECIAQLDEGAVEFLPFGKIKGRELFAANVLRTEDFLDIHKTEFSEGSGLPVRVAWRPGLPNVLPPIFKVKGSSDTYVSADFGRMAVEHGLTGLMLADPAKNRLQQIVRGGPINEFPGL